jgi:hypothetical protein
VLFDVEDVRIGWCAVWVRISWPNRRGTAKYVVGYQGKFFSREESRDVTGVRPNGEQPTKGKSKYLVQASDRKPVVACCNITSATLSWHI